MTYNKDMTTPDPTPRRTQAERTRASREKIIQAASELFARQGYRGAKLADIARAAGLTEPGLLHHFPSKNHLLMAVLAERDRADRKRFTHEQGTPIDSLQELMEYNETVPGMVQLFTILVAESIQPEHPGHDFFKQRYHKARSQDIARVVQCQQSGQIRADIPAEDLMVMLLAMMDGLQVQWLLEPEKINMTRLFNQFIQLLKK